MQHARVKISSRVNWIPACIDFLCEALELAGDATLGNRLTSLLACRLDGFIGLAFCLACEGGRSAPKGICGLPLSLSVGPRYPYLP